MSYSGTREVDDIVMPVATAERYAEWRRREGTRMLFRRGRWWGEIKPRFYECLHWLARHHQDEAAQPARLCWGFRTTLHPDDADYANGWLPVHLLSDLSGYDFAALPAKRRNKLRKSRRLNEIVQIVEPALLHDQGYRVRCAVAERLHIWKPPALEVYRAGLDGYLNNPCRLVLAGLHEGRLGGYVDAQAVDGTAYIDHVYLDSDCAWTEVGTGLVFELVQACRRAGTIREVAYGLDTPSTPSLSEFKSKMGFPLARVPTRYWIAGPMAAVIRLWQPDVYYRLTGSFSSLDLEARGGRPMKPLSPSS